MVIIYLAASLLIQSICLPSNVKHTLLKRAAFRRIPARWYTWHFSIQGLPHNTVTSTARELLPHIFTLIRQSQTVIFCGTFYPPKEIRPLTGVLPCAVRTFLTQRVR